ncbi:alpha/beta hydrolase [Acetonema longum]|uniref:Alpha/beta fold family hydrolase n=1 Tax=Acetonema longum DSM 6540 TaxID=1009370 RepID=F7NQ03_9FIRM|nr:alpha/beta hydrolase [Acetonema longum]EGO61880.1 alpha/beta fold family hydrolase [Acetonema longum DSM 6540]
MQQQHEWIFSRNKRLSAMIHADSFTVQKTPVVICCHGFTGDKIGANQLMKNIAKALVVAGFIAVRFDFAGSGESEGEFAQDTTVKGWREDLKNVIAWVNKVPEFEGLPIYLLGRSLGGLVVLSHTQDSIAERLALAPVVHPVANFQTEILGPGLWRQSLSGRPIANFLGKGFSIASNFVQDLAENRYEPQQHSSPLLIVHGNQDAIVPLSGSEELFREYQGEKEFKVIEADHVFTGKHEELTSLLTGWLATKIG